jgi:5-methylcytosine-specific restriction endonuclease McrA
VSASLLERRFKSQRGRCFYCRRAMSLTQDIQHPDGLRATREHLLPKSRGGGGEGNIVAACLRCNQARGSKPWLRFWFKCRKVADA